jgi:cobaltochelatase CobN
VAPLELLAAIALAVADAGPRPPAPRVLVLAGDNTSVMVGKAIRQFSRSHPELAARLAPAVVTEHDMKSLAARDLSSLEVLLVDSHSQNPDERVEKETKRRLMRQVAARGAVFVLGESRASRSAYEAEGGRFDEALRAYWAADGAQNVHSILCLLANRLLGTDLRPPPPKVPLKEGYYHPDGPGPFASYPAFFEWYEKSGRLRRDGGWVAVPFYGSLLQTEQTGIVDAVARSIEAHGLNALPLFGSPDKRVWEALLLDERGRARADVALAFSFRFSGPEAQAAVAKAGVPIINLMRTFGRDEQEWRASKTGLSVFETVFQVAIPEINGLISPMVVGADERVFDPELKATVVISKPIPERVEMAVRRAKRYVALRRKPNFEKRIALLYYNYPPGKANIGASYLNALRSVSVMIERLRVEGYDVGSGPWTEEEVTRRALAYGRNVGSYAPGELREMVAGGNGVRVSSDRYRSWLEALPSAFRDKLVKDWGEPDERQGMWLAGPSGLDLVIPVALYGKIAVLPQPDRGFGQDLKRLYHAMDVTPPHHYVGVYRWLRDDFGADAVVHVGTHGTLEWLSGKGTGLTESDAPDLMLDELPDSYIYNVDVVGEGLVAKRRGGANLVDHMIPPLKKGGLYGEYARIFELLNDRSVASKQNERLAASYSDEVRAGLAKLGLSRDLGLENASGPLRGEEAARVEDYLLELKEKNIPSGLHTFGAVPARDARRGTVAAVLEHAELDPISRRWRERELDRRIVESGGRELESWTGTLSGRPPPVGTGNDPVRNPDSLPTGKNFYGVDPSKVPKKAAWELGVRLADQMLKDSLERTGAYPKKVAFVIWGTETLRHEGVTESQFFHLLGTRPVWDSKGKVVDVEVIPRNKLGRPRIDVVISSAAEALFGGLTELMDRAVQKVNLLEETDNLVRANSLANAQKLEARGYSKAEALRRASVRIFDEPPGQYNLNVARIVQNSGSWDKETAVANDYLQKMGHGYGNGFWGDNMEDVFRLTLSGTDKVVHSASSALYGTLDNDDFFMYAGGLAQAIRTIDGRSPELLVADMQSAGSEKMRPVAEFMGMELRSRPLNPEWIRGMMKEGYAGAHEMREHLENLWGWQVTVPDSVGPEKWDAVFRTYVEDERALGLREFFESASPAARQDMLARMLEGVRKGYWAPSPEVRERLAKELVETTGVHGVSCASFVCQNPALAALALELGARAGLSAAALGSFRSRIEAASGKSLDEVAREMKAFIGATEVAHAERARIQTTRNVGPAIRGRRLEKEAPPAAHPPAPPDPYRQATLALCLFAAGVAGWLRLRRLYPL